MLTKDREYLDTLKACVDVRGLLGYYGASFHPMSNGNQLRCNCVVHGGQNQTSLVYKEDTKYFHCFGDCSFKGDIFALVSAVENCSFKDSIKRVEEFSAHRKCTATVSVKQSVDPFTRMLEETYSAENERNEVISSPLVESALRNKYNPYVESGRFAQETMDYFQVGYCEDNDYFMDRAIITIHDEHGHLIGFSGRDMIGTTNNKYRIKKGFKKGLCLYNLHRAKHFIDSKHPMIICEGFGQVWRLHEAGYDTAVALMGKEVTDGQYALISKYATKVILALDFDEPGVAATQKLGSELSRSFGVGVAVSHLAPDVDLGDMQETDAFVCISNAIPFRKWTTFFGGLT